VVLIEAGSQTQAPSLIEAGGLTILFRYKPGASIRRNTANT